MSLRAANVEKLDGDMFAVHLTDGGYIVVSAEDMASILLSRREKSVPSVAVAMPASMEKKQRRNAIDAK